MVDYTPCLCGNTKSQHFYVLGQQLMTDKSATHFYQVCNYAGFKPLYETFTFMDNSPEESSWQ